MKLLSKFISWCKIHLHRSSFVQADALAYKEEDIRHQRRQGSKEDLKIRQILLNTDEDYPEKDNAFLTYIPIMHNYDFALDYLNTYGFLSKIYTKWIIAKHNGKLPYKIERRLILSQKMNILRDITRISNHWSDNAKKLIKETITDSYLKQYLSEMM